MPKDPKYWCPKRVADHLGLENARTAAKLLRTGQIQGFKISGRYWRTTEWQVDAYAKRLLEAQQLTLRRPAA